MVLPLIPAAVGVGGGLLGGFAASLLGGSKKQSVSEVHATKEHYAPVVTDARAFTDARTWTTIADSPGSTVTVKKDITTSSDPDVSTTRSEEGGAGSTEGTDLTMIALIAGGAIVIHGLVKK